MNIFKAITVGALLTTSATMATAAAERMDPQKPRFTHLCAGFVALTDSTRLRGLAEFPASEEEYIHGMKHRHHISDDEFMIFSMFGQSQPALWMHETPHPLDILFIDQSGNVVFIAEHTRPWSKESIHPDSDVPISYAMEMRAGLSSELGFKVGATRIHVAPPTYCPAHIGG